MSDCDSQDDYSMWSRPFNFNGTALRVEEGWGVGIGRHAYSTHRLQRLTFAPETFGCQRRDGMGGRSPSSSILEVWYLQAVAASAACLCSNSALQHAVAKHLTPQATRVADALS